MCGIAGILSLDPAGSIDEAALLAMNDRMAHRGPDEVGSWNGGRIGLAMRRLAIIDLSTGQQPILNEDGTVRIVFNGEIYNFQELRADLQARGHSFRTRADTEVIVHLYEEHGVDCVRFLRGMFVFALWDAARERLLLARDRIGKKPLVYARVGGNLAWASEITALLLHPGIARDLDPVALDLYLGLQYVPSPRTIFSEIRKLPAGHRAVVEKGEMRVERWWELPRAEPVLDISEAEAEREVRKEVVEATRLRMIADVPVGAFLSGGIDSSVVVAAMAELSSSPVRTFSIGFDEDAYSELPHAREVARRFGTEHVELVVRSGMTDVLPEIAAQYGEPYADPSALPTWHLAQLTRRSVIVALNGDGGDEAFVGYRRYSGMKLAAPWDLLPAAVPRAAASLLEAIPAPGRSVIGRGGRYLRAVAAGTEAERYLRLVGCWPADDRRNAYSPAMLVRLGDDFGADVRLFRELFARGAGLDLLRRLQLVDVESYLADCLMPKVDIATMAHSLEARSPLLDHRVLELAFRLPARYKLRGITGTKRVLRRAFPELPPSILKRGKMGFGIPLAEWFRGPLRRTFEDTVLSPEALRRGAFREDALRRMLAEHVSGARDHGVRLWALLMLELWFRSSLPDGGFA